MEKIITLMLLVFFKLIYKYILFRQNTPPQKKKKQLCRTPESDTI